MSASRSALRMALVAGVLMIGSLAACGDDDDTSTTTTETSTTTTTTIETSTTTTTEATATTVAAVVSGIQAQLDEVYAQSTPPAGVTGPAQLVCADSGPIEVGDVFACQLRPQTEPGFDLETGSVVIYVLDSSGRAEIQIATDIPDSTETLRASYERAPKGLFCRDLLDRNDNSLYPFNQGFFWSLVYWSFEGEPDRMDADRNGIPCETLYEPEEVARVLDGEIQ